LVVLVCIESLVVWHLHLDLEEPLGILPRQIDCQVQAVVLPLVPPLLPLLCAAGAVVCIVMFLALQLLLALAELLAHTLLPVVSHQVLLSCLA
jgi:hypothetical protein